jgi:hypothetical protein
MRKFFSYSHVNMGATNRRLYTAYKPNGISQKCNRKRQSKKQVLLGLLDLLFFFLRRTVCQVTSWDHNPNPKCTNDLNC